MSTYLRTVRTISGATAVEIVQSSRRGSRDIEHIGSAHDDVELELLKQQVDLRLEVMSRRGGALAAGRFAAEEIVLLPDILPTSYDVGMAPQPVYSLPNPAISEIGIQVRLSSWNFNLPSGVRIRLLACPLPPVLSTTGTPRSPA